MPPRSEFRFALPREPRAPWGAWLVAVVLQLGLMVLLVNEPQVDRSPDAFRVLLPTALPQPSRDVTMRYQRPATTKRTVTPPVTAPVTRLVSPGAPRVMQPGAPGALGAPSGLVITQPPTDTGSAASNESPFRQHFGNGALWVRPMPMTPQEIATQLAGQSRQQIADSVLTAIIQGYLDRMAEERAHQGPALPSWVTTIGGKKVGVDQKWIYLGPIKLPTMLLSLLPINGGNPTAAEYNKRLSAMREDLYEAARRSANYDEFRKAVTELRTETQRKRDFEKNRRTAPDSGHSE